MGIKKHLTSDNVLFCYVCESFMDSTKDLNTDTWSTVLQQLTRTPTGCVSCRLPFKSASSCALGGGSGFPTASTLRLWDETGSTISWSSTTKQRGHEARDRRNLKSNQHLCYIVSLLMILHVMFCVLQQLQQPVYNVQPGRQAWTRCTQPKV